MAKIDEICRQYGVALCYLFGSQQALGLARLRRLARMDPAEFLLNDTPAIAESCLRRSLGAMFDLSRHAAAKQAGKAAVEYKQIARQLGQSGVVTPALGEKRVLMAA